MNMSNKILAERYQLADPLGAGSTSVTYRAVDLTNGDELAIKVLNEDLRFRKDVVTQFEFAFHCGKKIQHPNVLKKSCFIGDVGITAYVMELAECGSLDSRMRPNIKLPIAGISKLLRDLSAGLQAIHDADLTHRNIKPENILLFDDGSAKIGDFASACAKDGTRNEERGSVVGSIDYVAPEYMLECRVDWRSDIYGLGLLAYELITGRSPFEGDSVYATMTKRLKLDPNPPSTIRSDCPKQLDSIVLRMMNRDPLKRYQSATEIISDLDALT